MSYVAPTIFLAAPIVCLSLAVLLYFRFTFPLASLVCGSLYHALVALAGPLFLSPHTFSLPSGSGAVAPSFLLRIFLPALSSGALYIGALAPSVLSVLLLLPFLFTRVSVLLALLYFQGVLLRSPDSMRLCASSSFISFPRFFQDVLFTSLSSFSFLRLLFMAAYYFFYFTILCPFADPFDRMRVWLFFLYLCRLILLSLPLPVLVGSLVIVLCGLSHMSWTSLLLFLLRGFFRVFLLDGLFSGLFVCHTISSPLTFFSLGRVGSPLGSSSPLLPSCLPTASHGFLLWLPADAVRGLFPLVMRLSFCCLVAYAGVPGCSSWLVVLFSTVLIAIAISFLSVGFSLVYSAVFFIYLLAFLRLLFVVVC